MPLDPARVQAEIEAALRRDLRLTHPELIVTFVDGIGTVVLRGAVPSPPQRDAALEDAREVDGVFEVIHHLDIHPSRLGRRHDDELRAIALRRVIADPRIHPDHVDVKVAGGWATLTGSVATEAESAHVVADVAEVNGIAGVTNRLGVGRPAGTIMQNG